MPMIRETVVSTINAAGQVHFAPIGLIAEDAGWIIAPFRPSVTLDNLREVPFAVANFTDDVRVFAGCLTDARRGGRRRNAGKFAFRGLRMRSLTLSSPSRIRLRTTSGLAFTVGSCAMSATRRSRDSTAPRQP